MARYRYLYGDGNGLPGYWLIELDGHTCKLSHLDGLGYIAKILRYGSLHTWQLIGTEPPPPSLRISVLEAFWTDNQETEDGFVVEEANAYGTGETPQLVGGALSSRKVDEIIAELNRQQKAALSEGDHGRAKEIGLSVVAAREYKTATFRRGGKQRTFPSEFSRTNDAIRKAIDRTLAAIARQSVPISDYFKCQIRGVRGVWSYAGSEAWQLYLGNVEQWVSPKEEKPAGPKWGLQIPVIRPRHPNTMPGWPNRPNDPEMRTIRAFATPTGLLQDLYEASLKIAADGKSLKVKRPALETEGQQGTKHATLEKSL